MKVFRLLVFVCTCLCMLNNVEGQTFDWTKKFDTGGMVDPSDITIDVWGNTYAVGTYYAQMYFNDTTVIGNGNFESYIIKYDQHGNREWIKTFNTNLNCSSFAIAVDNVGNVYVDVNSGGTILINGIGYFNSVLVKMDPYGDVIWVANTCATADNVSLTIDDQNNIYIACAINILGNIGSVSNNNTNGGNDLLIAKLDSAGNTLWFNRIDGSGPTARPRGISLGSNGDLAVAAKYPNGAFMASVDTANGNIIQYFNQVFGTGNFEPQSTLADGQGNFVIGGTFQGSVNFGSNFLNSHGSNEIVMVSYDGSANLNWIRTIYSIGSNTSDFSLEAMAADSSGNYFVGGGFPSTGVFENDTLVVPGFATKSFIAKYDLNGNLHWVDTMGGSGGGSEMAKKIYIDSDQSIAITGVHYYVGVFGNDTLPYINGSENLYVSRYIGSSNMITGNVYIDWNNNGMYDSTESYSVGNFVTDTGGLSHSYTNYLGDYYLQIDTGNHIITPQVPLYHSVLPINHNIIINNYGVDTSNIDFRLIPDTTINDLLIDVVNFDPARPGFQVAYQLTYRNIGTTTLNGDVTLKFNSLLTIDSTDVIPSFQSMDSLSWAYSVFQPNETRTIRVYSTLSALAILGDTIPMVARIYPEVGDTIPVNNIDSLNQLITGSYDPNDKSVNPNTDVLLPFVQSGNEFEYIVRFQNTGTDTAMTVIIVDTISNFFDLHSFQYISSSHPCHINLRNNNRMEFIFNNILLPDSGADLSSSKGFIKYQLKPSNSVGLGDTFLNTALIYFDYNTPIITNTTSNLVYIITDVEEGGDKSSINLNLFPNPARETIYYTLETKSGQLIEISILDINGKMLSKTARAIGDGHNKGSLDFSNHAKGFYLIQFKGRSFSTTKKVVVK